MAAEKPHEAPRTRVIAAEYDARAARSTTGRTALQDGWRWRLDRFNVTRSPPLRAVFAMTMSNIFSSKPSQSRLPCASAKVGHER